MSAQSRSAFHTSRIVIIINWYVSHEGPYIMVCDWPYPLMSVVLVRHYHDHLSYLVLQHCNFNHCNCVFVSMTVMDSNCLWSASFTASSCTCPTDLPPLPLSPALSRQVRYPQGSLSLHHTYSRHCNCTTVKIVVGRHLWYIQRILSRLTSFNSTAFICSWTGIPLITRSIPSRRWSRITWFYKTTKWYRSTCQFSCANILTQPD